MGATTTAFLAGGLHAIGPKQHTALAQELVDEGGGYWTEQPFSQIPLKQFFPVRNRLIAGASMATFVVEAARKSGALITNFFTSLERLFLNASLYEALARSSAKPRCSRITYLPNQCVHRGAIFFESIPNVSSTEDFNVFRSHASGRLFSSLYFRISSSIFVGTIMSTGCSSKYSSSLL